MRRLVAGLLMMVLWGGAPARAERAPGKSIAVLEFRGGTTGMKNVGTRLARILRKHTSHPIVDGDDARRLAGPRIDAEVARCSGEARCIALLGQQLGVDEVLLVGVSELGDLILALQIVDVGTAQVVSRVADSLPRGADPDDASLETYATRLLPPADFVRFGTLRIDADVAGAAVEVAGRTRGETPLPPLEVEAPATLDLRVSKDGYVDFRARVDVLPDATVAVNAAMTLRPGSAWYQKWWVWTIAGGVIVAGVTTVVIVSQPSAHMVPVTVGF